MELCEGGELWAQTLSRDGSRSGVPAHPSLARCWVAELVDAVAHVHGCGLVHRDIKPENMMLTASGRVKLIDFGTAKDLVDTDLNGPEFVGTPEFMAPEAIASEKDTAYAADLWAIGIVAYCVESDDQYPKISSTFSFRSSHRTRFPRFPGTGRFEGSP